MPTHHWLMPGYPRAAAGWPVRGSRRHARLQEYQVRNTPGCAALACVRDQDTMAYARAARSTRPEREGSMEGSQTGHRRGHIHSRQRNHGTTKQSRGNGGERPITGSVKSGACARPAEGPPISYGVTKFRSMAWQGCRMTMRLARKCWICGSVPEGGAGGGREEDICDLSG